LCIPKSGQSASMTCSRWRRWPGARTSSFTRLLAFLKRHRSSLMVREPTETRKPPSSHTRTVSRLLPVGASGCVMPSKPEEGRLIPSPAPLEGQAFPRYCLLIFLQDWSTCQ
jgi:hypothetical protein